MSLLSGIAYLFVFGVSGVVSWFCLDGLLRRGGRITSRGEFERWRILPAALLLLLAVGTLFFARRSELICQRVSGVVTCSIEQRRFQGSFHRLLPPNGLRDADVEEHMGTDADGFPERQSRLWVDTDLGRFSITDFGQGDAHRLRAQVRAFLADGSQRELAIGQDTRWFFYPQLPMWLLLALFSLIGRW